MFERSALADLEAWGRLDTGRKPLLIRGARQVGKTTLVRMLAQRLGLPKDAPTGIR